MMAFHEVEWMGIRQNVVEVSMSATWAPRPQQEHVPATGFVCRTFLFWLIRKQKQTIFLYGYGKCVCWLFVNGGPSILFIYNNPHYSLHPLFVYCNFPFYPSFSRYHFFHYHLFTNFIFNSNKETHVRISMDDFNFDTIKMRLVRYEKKKKEKGN